MVEVSKRAREFQARVQPWMMECFGAEIAADVVERNDRFIEEALELVQANGYDATRAHALVDYVFGRPVGDPGQEVGGVMVTLAALCLAAGLNMHEAGETELARIMRPEIIEKIRAKQAAKPTGSALPIALADTKTETAMLREALEKDFRWRANQCRTNHDAFDTKAAAIWDMAADAVKDAKPC